MPATKPPPPKTAAPKPTTPAPTSPATTSNGTLKELTTGKAVDSAPRVVINATEGFGKSTIGASAPNPIFLMSRGETGYETLLGAGLVPEIPRTEVETWKELLDRVAWLETQSYDTIVLDALNGFERLCHETVCKRDFKGDWGEKGFASYGKGFAVSMSEWILLLSALDRVRKATGATIILLSHSLPRTFKNPLGEDFDRYIADVHEKTWGATTKWADAVLFGNFHTVIEQKKGGRAKGIGGADRVIYAERRDAFDAKNRYGMSEAFSLSSNPAESWSIIHNEMQGGTQ